MATDVKGSRPNRRLPSGYFSTELDLGELPTDKVVVKLKSDPPKVDFAESGEAEKLKRTQSDTKACIASILCLLEPEGAELE